MSFTDAVQYIWYVSGRIMAKMFSGVYPYRARNAVSHRACATWAESTIICIPILRARLPMLLMVPERVIFCGVCHPCTSILTAYTAVNEGSMT